MNRSRTSKNIKIVLSVLLVIIIVNIAFAGNDEMSQTENDIHPADSSRGQVYDAKDSALYMEEAQEAVPEAGSVPPAESEDTFSLHGNITLYNSADLSLCSGYTLKIQESGKEAKAGALGQYIFPEAVVGQNTVEVYNQSGEYMDEFTLIFNHGYSNAVDYTNKIIYVDLDDASREPEFKDKFQVSFVMDEIGRLHFDQMGTYNDIMGDFKIVSILDTTINIYGQVVQKGDEGEPVPGIKIMLEGLDRTAVTGEDGGYMFADVPIRNQKLIFFDSDMCYISEVMLMFNIDGGDICLNSLQKMILDIGNSDGVLFDNMQIGFTIDIATNYLGYDKSNIIGNVESPKNQTLYAIICFTFIIAFLFVVIFIDKRNHF